MRRSQVLALLGVALLLLGAVALRDRDGGATDTRPPGPDLTALRAEAALAPCPQGLGPELPDLVLPCLGGGEPVDLRWAPPGRPTLVNVWASWCAPCQDEVPELVAFAEKAGDRVGLVGVLNTDTEVKGLAFSRDFGIRYPSVVDADGEVLRAFPGGLPTTIFLSADGRVQHVERGEVESLAELEALVAEHLGVTL